MFEVGGGLFARACYAFWGAVAWRDGHHPRTPYASDVADEEWAFLAPYLTLMREDAPQRTHPLRERFNGLRFIARTGLQWRFMPHDLPPWPAV